MKRIVARISGVTSAGGLARALKDLMRQIGANPYVMGAGETFAGVALELTYDTDDGVYEIEIRPDP